MSSVALEFHVDEEMKKEKDKKRRQQRQRMGFTTKRRKLAKPKDLCVHLESKESWLRYVRFMLIAGYKKVQSESKDEDAKAEVLDMIEECCPPVAEESTLLEAEAFEDKNNKKVLEEWELGALCELVCSYVKESKMEPGMVVRASEMMEKLRVFFPVSKEALKDSPYDNECKFNTVSEEDINKVADSFKEAAKHRHVGAEFVVPEE